MTNGDTVLGDQGCPNCGSKEGVFFIGSQSATLSSVAIDELFGSVLNSDPKLLAFTDSVQDASHRAGFFTARTYQFTFRTALQHVIDASEPPGVPLTEAGERVLAWWSEPRPGWAGAVKEAMASLVPPDLHDYTDFREFRDNRVRRRSAAFARARHRPATHLGSHTGVRTDADSRTDHGTGRQRLPGLGRGSSLRHG